MIKRTCTFAQKIAIHDRLKEELELISEGTYRFKNLEITDNTIAKELGVSINSVQNIRIEIFGKLRKRVKNNDNNEIEFLKSEINNIKGSFVKLITHDINDRNNLNELTIKYNKLIDTLQLNKVVNVHHLKLNKNENE